MISYLVRRSSRRRKSVQITIDPQEGVIVSTPVAATRQEIADIVRGRADWILKRANQLLVHPARERLVSGASVPYLGKLVSLTIEPVRAKRVKVAFAGSVLDVAVPAELGGEERPTAVARALERWYRQRAMEDLRERVRRWVPVIGRAPEQVIVRDQRRRWGSCSATGVIRFNWRLIQLDPSLIDYVVVHELAHLLEDNHGPGFWQIVGRVLPDYQPLRRQLRDAGASVVL